MFSDGYLARVNEIADSGLPPMEQVQMQIYAVLDETLVEVFSQDRDKWADALRERGMSRVADAIDRQIQP